VIDAVGLGRRSTAGLHRAAQSWYDQCDVQARPSTAGRACARHQRRELFHQVAIVDRDRHVRRYLAHASISPEPHVRSSPNSCTLPAAVAQSCSGGGVAIRYVLPVLWMASCLHMIARNRRSKRRIHNVTQQGTSRNSHRCVYFGLCLRSVPSRLGG